MGLRKSSIAGEVSDWIRLEVSAAPVFCGLLVIERWLWTCAIARRRDSASPSRSYQKCNGGRVHKHHLVTSKWCRDGSKLARGWRRCPEAVGMWPIMWACLPLSSSNRVMKWVGCRASLLIRCNIAGAGIHKNCSFGTYPSETALQYPGILDYA